MIKKLILLLFSFQLVQLNMSVLFLKFIQSSFLLFNTFINLIAWKTIFFSDNGLLSDFCPLKPFLNAKIYFDFKILIFLWCYL